MCLRWNSSVKERDLDTVRFTTFLTSYTWALDKPGTQVIPKQDYYVAQELTTGDSKSQHICIAWTKLNYGLIYETF